MNRKSILLFICATSLLVGCEKNEFETFFDGTEVYVSFEATGENVLLVTESDGEGGTTTTETGSIGWVMSQGSQISSAPEEWGVESIEAICKDDTFEGWMAYKMSVITDEDGFETSTSERISGDTLYTTEEVLAMEVPNHDVTYYAKCKSIPIEDYD